MSSHFRRTMMFQGPGSVWDRALGRQVSSMQGHGHEQLCSNTGMWPHKTRRKVNQLGRTQTQRLQEHPCVLGSSLLSSSFLWHEPKLSRAARTCLLCDSVSRETILQKCALGQLPFLTLATQSVTELSLPGFKVKTHPAQNLRHLPSD